MVNSDDLSFDNEEFIEFDEGRATYDRYGGLKRIYLGVTHTKLNLYKEISAIDELQLHRKLDELLHSWGKKYQDQLSKLKARTLLDEGKAKASDITNESSIKRSQIDSILLHTLSVDDTVNWTSLKTNEKWKKTNFSSQKPREPEYPKVTAWRDSEFKKPKISFFDMLFLRRKKITEKALKDFKKQQKNKKKEQEIANSLVLKQIEKMEQEFRENIALWKERKRKWDLEQTELRKAFEVEQELHNIRIDRLEAQWKEGCGDAVIEHAEIVLGASEYPEWMEKSYFLQFDEERRLLKLEFHLPTPNVVNLVKSARFVSSTGKVQITYLSDRDKKNLYESLCFQIALRSVHEIFEADKCNNISSLLFNGVVDFVDGATGAQTRATIMSAVFEKDKFENLNLKAVDPKTCFKSFNGVAAASLIGLAPINPVIRMQREDTRFVENQNSSLDDLESQNLASMGWEEFEHLVRAIFEKEFAVAGGEVKVTQASSDGGVDAIAFDPDPIRGGKIVIQAKRYTNTVSVAAVRELFGTVMNEGATKGILVTTADYGTDAYKFAADKPITLLNGGNLLYLLEKHGVKGKIDVKSARKDLGLT